MITGRTFADGDVCVTTTDDEAQSPPFHAPPPPPPLLSETRSGSHLSEGVEHSTIAATFCCLVQVSPQPLLPLVFRQQTQPVSAVQFRMCWWVAGTRGECGRHHYHRVSISLSVSLAHVHTHTHTHKLLPVLRPLGWCEDWVMLLSGLGDW